MCDCSLIHGLWPVDWLDGQGLGKSRVGVIWGRSGGIDVSKRRKGVKTHVSYVHGQQKVTSAREKFHKHVGG